MKKLIKKISIILSIALIACLFTGCNSSKEVVNFLNYGENIDSETLKLFGLTSSYRLHKKYRNNVRKNNFKYHKNDMVISKFIKS